MIETQLVAPVLYPCTVFSSFLKFDVFPALDELPVLHLILVF